MIDSMFESIVKNLTDEPGLTLVGSRITNNGTKECVTFKINDSDFYIFLLCSEESIIGKLFERRKTDEVSIVEIQDPIDVLLVCNIITVERLLDVICDFRVKPILFHLNLFN